MHYTFPGTKHTADTLKLTWYEAGKQPPKELFKAPADWPGSQNGVLYVGGVLAVAGPGALEAHHELAALEAAPEATERPAGP